MNKRSLRLQDSDSVCAVSELRTHITGWMLVGEINQHSPSTQSNRRLFTSNLLWFLDQRKFADCGIDELRAFFAYVTNGHKEKGGRWGNSRLINPLTPRTVKDYHSCLRTLFNWIVSEGRLEASPMERIPVPIDRPDKPEPFTEDQVNALLNAAKRSLNARRDEAILWLLLDSGLRASELGGLKMKDLDMTARRATVEGKGGKKRTVPFSKIVALSLWKYLQYDGEREPDDPVFQTTHGTPLDRYALKKLIGRLAKVAGITRARCSPHTFRNTFSVMFLRNGGDQFSLMEILGHTNVQMTNRYVQLVQADVDRKHRQYSPAESLKRGKQK